MSDFKKKLKESDNKLIRLTVKVHHSLWELRMKMKNSFYQFLYYFFRIFPVKKNKIVASSFSGKKYGDNTSYILDELIKLNNNLDIVWLQDDEYNYKVPNNFRVLSFWKNNIRKIYEYATATVWIDTHLMRSYMRKRKRQLFIETWHGGLGIKKIHGDIPVEKQNIYAMAEVRNTARIADVFISNCDHLTNVYKSAFGYNGTVWKCGYPKNDMLFSDNNFATEKVKKYYGIASDKKILVYAPTFRNNSEDEFDMSVFDIDFYRLHETLIKKFGGKWVVLVKYHPIMINKISYENTEYFINATRYPEMQEIVHSADIFITDYSSCIFDAAIRDIPCFTYAVDFERYKSDVGVYYEMNELPFPYARSNDELFDNILGFDYQNYIKKWNEYKKLTGLYETGHAAYDIAHVINEFIKGNKKPLEEIKNEK